MEDAVKGQNLLAMVEEPKATFGRGEESMRRAHEETGSALMDFFVDPTEIFASERHPALKEVLAVLAKSKSQRGTFQISEKIKLIKKQFFFGLILYKHKSHY